MEHLRLATPEEVAAIQEQSDITPFTTVFCLDDQKAVVRQVVEVDPYYKGTATKGQVAKFFWGLEERLLGMGVAAYYMNVDCDEASADWRGVIEHWGAENITPNPSFRYKRLLIKNGN